MPLMFSSLTYSASYAQNLETLSVWLATNNCRGSIRISQYDYNYYNKPLSYNHFDFSKINENGILHSGENAWKVGFSVTPDKNRTDVFEVEFICTLLKGYAPQTAISLDFSFSNWSTKNYVLMPAATYNGNRFESRRIQYSPKLLDPRDISPKNRIIISDIPRLNIGAGPSRIQERSGGMSVPAIGFYSEINKSGFFILTTQGTQLGDNGISIEESRDRNRAVLSLTFPVVRENYKYFIADNQDATPDKAPDFITGDSFTVRFRLYAFKCSNIQGLFDRFFDLRKDYAGNNLQKPFLPFSACFEVQEKKYNQQNWVGEYGYYSVGMRENFLQDWQIGWTGGMINTYPLLFAGNDTSRQRVVRNFDWLFPDGICPAGFFWDSGEKGINWYGGDIRKPHTRNWHLIRKSGDGLYYIIKQFMLMEKMNMPVKEEWKNGTKGVANAFVKLWNNWKQFGQFVDSQTGDVVVGGSTSGAIVPAALVLAAQYFNDEEYLTVAKASADSFYLNFVKKGVTCGGPGDALQNPDSESAYAMLESFALLYEHTQDKKWLTMAEEMTRQFATWVMPYNYKFPETSALGKLGAGTVGIVGANTQNRHGAPGICTYSGIALWRLYRATGNTEYMNLLKEIASCIPQYMSHPLRTIEKMKDGWLSERVSTTDWLEGIGELMYGSTWAEISLMLSFIELPGVYVQPDKSYICAIDNVEAEIVQDKPRLLKVKLTNPTRADASIRLFVESSNQAHAPLGENVLKGGKIINLCPGESSEIIFRK